MSELRTKKQRRFPSLSYMQYSAMSPELQNDYLDWCQAQFEIEWARLQFERQGGINGLARKKAQQEVDWIERVTTWSYLQAYIPNDRQFKNFSSNSMYNHANANVSGHSLAG